MFTLYDYVYLTERLYINDIQSQTEEENVTSEDNTATDSNENIYTIISKEEEQSMHR